MIAVSIPGDGPTGLGREPAAAQPGHHELSVEPGRVYSGQRLDRRPGSATRPRVFLRRGVDLCRPASALCGLATNLPMLIAMRVSAGLWRRDG